MSIESILLAVTRITTFSGNRKLTGATGFYFKRNKKLFLITNRHVLIDEANGHLPDSVEILLHSDPTNLTSTGQFSMPLYDDNQAQWVEAKDSAGTVDVVALPIDTAKFPKNILYTSFSEDNIPRDLDEIEVGASIRAVGFPLGFHDTLHNLPVMRHAIIASSFGLRFQGYGYFITDSLLHRGSSGSPIVARISKRKSARSHFPWILLGIHSARLDTDNREPQEDERINLFTAWYSDVLMTLTA